MKLKIIELDERHLPSKDEPRQYTFYFYGMSDTEVAKLVHLLTSTNFGVHEVKLISATRDVCIISVKTPYLENLVSIIDSEMQKRICVNEIDF